MNFIPRVIRRRIAHRPNLVKIIDNIGWLFFDKILRMGVGLFVGVWIARYLGPERLGLLGFATAFVGLFGPIATLGLQGVVVRDIVRNPSGAEETLGTAAALHVVGGVIAYGLILATISWLRPDDSLVKVMVGVLGSMMLLQASQVAVYWFESQVISKYTVWVQSGVFLVFAAVKVVLILNEEPLVAFVWAMLVEAAVVALALLAVLGLRGPALTRLSASVHRAKSLLLDSWPLILSAAAIMIYMKIDQVMLGQMVGSREVGIYSAAVNLVNPLFAVTNMIVASLFPTIVSMIDDSVVLRSRLLKLYSFVFWTAVCVAFPTVLLAEWIIVILYGSEYYEASEVLAVYVLSLPFAFWAMASSRWYLAKGLQVKLFQRAFIGAIVNIALNYVFISAFGLIGAAYATLISYALVGLMFDLHSKSTKDQFSIKLSSVNPLRLKRS